MGIATLPIVDIRHLLVRRPSRFLLTRLLKLIAGSVDHYNGPETAIALSIEAEIRHLQAIAQYHVGKIWGYSQGVAIYGHGIMYHYAIGATGTIYWLRNLSDILWHCGNGAGNNTTVAVHTPIGDKQRPTDKQWESKVMLFEALADDRGFDAKSATKGHKEWGQSECPGPVLMPMLENWRKQPTPVLKRYRIKYNDSKCRQGPGRNFPVAATFDAGHEFDGKIVIGESINGNNVWLWRADGLGFIHSSLVEDVWYQATDSRGFLHQSVIV